MLYLLLFFLSPLRSSLCFLAPLPSSSKSDTTSRLLMSHSTVSKDEIFREMLNQHAIEISRGFETFGRRAGENRFTYDNFEVISMDKGSGGPTESVLSNSNIFITKEPILTPEECKAVIADAVRSIESNVSKMNNQLNEAKLSDLTTQRKFLTNLLHDKLFPILENAFGIDAKTMTLNDGLVLHYVGPSRSQPIHRDASLLTLQIALSSSSDFKAGGTYVETLGDAILMEEGHVMCHSSGTMHAGKAIESGERWVLVMFVLSESEPQLAKRCHAAGVSKMDEGDYVSAEKYFRSGLDATPSSDHLLHISLANCYLAQGENKKARNQLLLAQSYKHCSRAFLLHAKQLISISRPRAALRRLDQALDRIAKIDLKPGAWTPLKALAWECRVQAGMCACLCAEKELSMTGVDKKGELNWSRKHLPTALERLRIALDAAPEHMPLLRMIARAEELIALAGSQPCNNIQ